MHVRYRWFLLFAAVVIMFGLFGCSKNEVMLDDPGLESMTDSGSAGSVVKGMELICLAESKQEAEEIASSYGIDLVDFSNGVAAFHTDEDPQAVIEKGKDKGLKELSLNRLNR